MPGIRNVLEVISTVCHIVVNEGELRTLQKGELDSTRTIASAKKVFPPFGQVYGLLSDHFTHVSTLHYDTANPIKEYTKDEEALKMNLNFLRLTIWLINVVAELAFFDDVSAHRYFKKVTDDAFVYAPSDHERRWMEQFLEPQDASR
jgi:hypothetical protein